MVKNVRDQCFSNSNVCLPRNEGSPSLASFACSTSQKVHSETQHSRIQLFVMSQREDTPTDSTPRLLKTLQSPYKQVEGTGQRQFQLETKTRQLGAKFAIFSRMTILILDE